MEEWIMEGLVPYSDSAPERADVDAMKGPLVLEFGSNTCGICHGAAPIIAQAMRGVAASHIRVEDGKGRPLGRSFGIKLWPTLIALRDGREIARVVRPTTVEEIKNILQFVS
jgi:thioredoxin 1